MERDIIGLFGNFSFQTTLLYCFTNNLQYIFTYIIHKIFIQQIQSFFTPILKPPPAMEGGRRGINALFQSFTGEKYNGVCCVATGPADC
jgi:hypothetical protein